MSAVPSLQNQPPAATGGRHPPAAGQTDFKVLHGTLEKHVDGGLASQDRLATQGLRHRIDASADECSLSKQAVAIGRCYLCVCCSAGGGAGEPSDQRRTGMKSTVDSISELSLPSTGEPSAPAPHTAV
jgi:hypothetical protein